MWILHTADWHLNNRLGRVDLQPLIQARLEEISTILKAEKVDVMVVAGDLFSRHARIDELRNAVQDVDRIFKPFLMDGGTIVAISGNHDNEALFQMLRLAMDLASPVDLGSQEPRPAGRLYLAAGPSYLLLQDRAGQHIQFALLPYPTAARYLDHDVRPTSQDERNQLLRGALVRRLEQIKERHIRPHLHSVLVSHLHVRGSAVHTTYQITERDDVVFEPSEIPMHWAYVAYGHIHKPQSLNGDSHVRYSGSIERFDYAERDDDKGVVLVEVGPGGRKGEPRILPLNATPIYRVELEIQDPDRDLASMRERYETDASRALVSYHVTYRPGEHDRDAIRREIEKLFPFCYEGRVVPIGSAANVFEAALPRPRDVLGTVLDYVKSQTHEHDPDREELLRMAEQFWTSREEVEA